MVARLDNIALLTGLRSEFFGQVLAQRSCLRLEEARREQLEHLNRVVTIFAAPGRLVECQKGLEQVHMRILAADRIWRGLGIAIPAFRGGEAFVEKADRVVDHGQDLRIAGEPEIPGKPQQDEGMAVDVPHRTGDRPVRRQRKHQPGLPSAS